MPSRNPYLGKSCEITDLNLENIQLNPSYPALPTNFSFSPIFNFAGKLPLMSASLHQSVTKKQMKIYPFMSFTFYDLQFEKG